MSDDARYAKGNIDTEGFAELLDSLMKAAWGENWGTFTDQEPTGTTPENLPLPIISWDVVRRVPSEAMKQPKHRNWGTIEDPNTPGEFLTVFRQWFDCEIEFKVWTKTSHEAKQLAKRLEALLLAYTGFFKEQGLQDLTFLSETSEGVQSTGRQDIACRRLLYLARVESIYAERTSALDEIQAKVKAARPGDAQKWIQIAQRF